MSIYNSSVRKFPTKTLTESPVALLKFYLTKRFYVIIGVVALILTPTLVYYAMSYNSVNGIHPEIVTGYRQIGIFSATFYVTVHVWSWATSIDTQVSGPVFTLAVDNFPFGTQAATSGIFQPNNYISYTLRFEVNDGAVARAVNSASNNLVLQMSAEVSAGWFRQLITRSDSDTWRFSE